MDARSRAKRAKANRSAPSPTSASRRRRLPPPRRACPIPYPNTGMDSDSTDGSKTVMISDKEVMLKNKSYFKQSTGRRGRLRSKERV